MAKKDAPGAIAQLQEAMAIQDTLKYDEPPDWFFRCVSRWALRC